MARLVEARFDPRRILKAVLSAGLFLLSRVEARFDPRRILKEHLADSPSPGGSS